MDKSINKSIFLARALGLYLVIIALAFFANMQNFKYTIDNLINNGSLMFVVGFFTLIIGILMIVSHNIWEFSWKVLITIISWMVFLKGLSILFFPKFIDTLTQLFLQSTLFDVITLGIDFIIGLILIYHGFKTKKA